MIFIFFSIIGLFYYACSDVINNIQLLLKGLKILIQPPLSILVIFPTQRHSIPLEALPRYIF